MRKLRLVLAAAVLALTFGATACGSSPVDPCDGGVCHTIGSGG